jgi:electron transfer flavoprotein beta subunit
VAIAGHLELPHVAVVKGLQLDAGVATVQRELEGGLVEVLRVAMPALLTIQTGINEPRYATLRAIKQARDKPLEELGLGDLGLDEATVSAAAGARVRRLRHPESGEGAQMLDGSPEEVAARIADIVKEGLSG